MTENRFVTLEEKITHQEFLIEKLNSLVSDQQVRIYQLEEQILGLAKEMKDLFKSNNKIGPANEKPPHY